ncbi:MAG: exosome complex RNA-binding protein Csl4 [Candidatus Hydrothermarchaeales archaeon]
MENGTFVVPGDVLGYSEEFLPGDGAYEEDGTICAAVTGKVSIDMKERKLTVIPATDTPPVPKEGDIVIGKVVDIKPQVAVIDIVKIKGNDRGLPGSIRGGVHISQSRNVYVSDLSREFSPGDIIVAKITNTKRRPIQLSTVDKELGVIKAYCSFCNLPMPKEGNILKCNECRRSGRRKMSSEYGKGEV